MNMAVGNKIMFKTNSISYADFTNAIFRSALLFLRGMIT